MAISGNEIGKRVEMKADKTYTGYYDPIKMNRLLNMCLMKIVDQKVSVYRQNQKIADEIQPLVVYGLVLAVNNNRIPTVSFPVSNMTYVGTAITVTVENRVTGLVPGDVVTFNPAPTGITGIDATATVLAASGSSFTFTNSGTPTGTYTAYSAAISTPKFVSDYYRLLNLKCNFPADSQNNFIVGADSINEKGKVFGQSTTRFPRVEMSENFIVIEPVGTACDQVEIYYVKRPPRHVDVNDTVYDYSLYLNEKMLDHLTDVAARNWSGYIKDPDSFRVQDILITDNP